VYDVGDAVDSTVHWNTCVTFHISKMYMLHDQRYDILVPLLDTTVSQTDPKSSMKPFSHSMNQLHHKHDISNLHGAQTMLTPENSAIASSFPPPPHTSPHHQTSHTHPTQHNATFLDNRHPFRRIKRRARRFRRPRPQKTHHRPIPHHQLEHSSSIPSPSHFPFPHTHLLCLKPSSNAIS
jgi:hypothetical protein